MSWRDCDVIARQLEAFVDGELSVQDRTRVSEHLSHCDECALATEEFRSIGEVLRRSAQEETAFSEDLSGLSDSVIGRLQAERAQTWRAQLQRGVDDWHWLLVGSGSVAATFTVTMFLSAVLIAGPAPERKDSLASVYNNLSSSAGTLLVIATPVGEPRNSMMLQVSGADEDPANPAPGVAASDVGFASEGDYVRALAEAVTQNGRLVDLASMPKENRAYAEKLLGDINHMRSGSQVRGTGPVTVRQIVLRASASVSAKGL